MPLLDRFTDVRRLKLELKQTADRLDIEQRFNAILLAQLANRNEVIASLRKRHHRRRDHQARAELEQDKLLTTVAEVEDAHKRAAKSKLVFKEAKP